MLNNFCHLPFDVSFDPFQSSTGNNSTTDLKLEYFYVSHQNRINTDEITIVLTETTE